MDFITRDEFAARARESVPLRGVDVEGIGTVAVQAMTGLDLQEYADATADGLGDNETMAFMRAWIARLTCDGAREPLFSGGDDPALLALPVEALVAFASDVFNAAGVSGDEDEGKDEGPSESGGEG